MDEASGTDERLAIIAWLVPIWGGITGYFTYAKNVNTVRAAMVCDGIWYAVFPIFSLLARFKYMWYFLP